MLDKSISILDANREIGQLSQVMETTVLKAKNQLSELLRKAEEGEEILIRRGRKGRLFRIVPVREPSRRTLAVHPQFKGKVLFKDEDIWASEWKEDA